MSEAIQRITHDGRVLAILMRGAYAPDATTFETEAEDEQQMGVLVYRAGDKVPAHGHRAPVRELHSCPECLVVREGKCELTLFGEDREPISTHILEQGDTVLLLDGGHAFKALEDARVLCVRAGAYSGDESKEAF